MGFVHGGMRRLQRDKVNYKDFDRMGRIDRMKTLVCILFHPAILSSCLVLFA